MLFTIDPDGTVRPPEFTKARIVKPPPGSGEVFIVDGDPRWWVAHAGAEPVPFFGPYVAEWLEERSETVRRG